MATKWKIFKARTDVKAIAFLIAVISSFVICTRLLNVVVFYDNVGIEPDVILSKIHDGDYFYRQHMGGVYYNAQTLLYFGSEESIIASEHIKLDKSTNGVYIRTPNDSIRYRWYGASELPPDFDKLTDDELREFVSEGIKEAMNEQLTDYRSAKNTLQNTDGLLYTIVDGNGNILFDNTGASEDYYREKLVYLISVGGFIEESSHAIRDYYPWSYRTVDSGAKILLAFSAEAINAANEKYAAVKTAYLIDLVIIKCALIFLIASIVLLMAGAGRRTSDDGKSVHLLAIDRVFLDIGLVLCAAWIFLIIMAAIWIADEIWHYRNMTAMNILFAGASTLIIVPKILWFQTFAKRVKLGGFYRYTLLWSVPSGIVKLIKKVFSNLRLTVKVAIIGVCAYLLLTLIGIVGDGSDGGVAALLAVPAAVLALVPLMRYAHRLHKLEQGAKKASEGGYNEKIETTGGVLGRIAESINNISAGINIAVNERMKSERLKTELITNVSHDIRTPLTSIITYADLLKSEGLSCEKAPEYLDVLINKSQRLKTLTDELFEAAKAASGNIETDIKTFNLTALIRQTMGELDSSITDSSLDFRISLPDTIIVKADGKLMQRVMENLLTNVLKYSLPASRVYLSAERDGAFVRVDVKNISAEPLNVEPSELTERFKRGDQSRSDGGSGLGLSIVQSFMNIQNGRLVISIDGDLFKASIYVPSASETSA